MGYCFRLAARVLLYASSDQTHTTAFVTPVVQHWLEREIAQRIHMKDRSDDPSHHKRTLLPQSYISLLNILNAFLIIKHIILFMHFLTLCRLLDFNFKTAHVLLISVDKTSEHAPIVFLHHNML